jgi:alanyl-tRNA synthetase
VTVDEAGFDAAMARQREQARAAGKFKMAAGLEYTAAHHLPRLRHLEDSKVWPVRGWRAVPSPGR